MSSARRLVLTSLLLASGLGCATARNYEDPAVPVYRGGVADRRDAGATLRVVTFDLKWGKEIDRAVELLSRPGPLRGADRVVLEEMDREGTERLGRALGLAYVYVPSAGQPVPKHDFGVALLAVARGRRSARGCCSWQHRIPAARALEADLGRAPGARPRPSWSIGRRASRASRRPPSRTRWPSPCG